MRRLPTFFEHSESHGRWVGIDGRDGIGIDGRDGKKTQHRRSGRRGGLKITVALNRSGVALMRGMNDRFCGPALPTSAALQVVGYPWVQLS